MLRLLLLLLWAELFLFILELADEEDDGDHRSPRSSWSYLLSSRDQDANPPSSLLLWLCLRQSRNPPSSSSDSEDFLHFFRNPTGELLFFLPSAKGSSSLNSLKQQPIVVCFGKITFLGFVPNFGKLAYPITIISLTLSQTCTSWISLHNLFI